MRNFFRVSGSFCPRVPINRISAGMIKMQMGIDDDGDVLGAAAGAARLHTDDTADLVAAAHHARALTVGESITFKRCLGQKRPLIVERIS